MIDKMNENTSKVNKLRNKKIKVGGKKLYKKAVVKSKLKKEEIKKNIYIINSKIYRQ